MLRLVLSAVDQPIAESPAIPGAIDDLEAATSVGRSARHLGEVRSFTSVEDEHAAGFEHAGLPVDPDFPELRLDQLGNGLQVRPRRHRQSAQRPEEGKHPPSRKATEQPGRSLKTQESHRQINSSERWQN